MIVTMNDGTRLSRLAIIYGANASGKSNILTALKTFGRVLRQGISGNYHPNRLVLEKQQAPSEFSVALNIGEEKLCYELCYDRNHCEPDLIYPLRPEALKADGMGL